VKYNEKYHLFTGMDNNLRTTSSFHILVGRIIRNHSQTYLRQTIIHKSNVKPKTLTNHTSGTN